jgi:hypothetical protein
MDTNTLNVIERSLTLLLPKALSSADDTPSKLESHQISWAVLSLNTLCDSLLIRALPTTQDLGNIKGKMMSENIDTALERYRKSNPYSQLSNDNKMIVLRTVTERHAKHYNTLRQLQYNDPWGEYERRTYNSLVTALQKEYMKVFNEND